MPSLKENGKRLNGKGGGWITKARRLAIYLRDGFTCQYCGTDLHDARPRAITLDHLKPQAKDGTHASRNLVTACLSCNSKRQTTPWRWYAPPGAIARITRNIRRVPNMALARAILEGRVSRSEVVS